MIHKTVKKSRLRTALISTLLLFLSLIFGLAFIPPLKAVVWQSIYRHTDLCDEYAKQQLIEVADYAGQFWFEQFLNHSLYTPRLSSKSSDEAGQILADMKDSGFRRTCHSLIESVDTNRINRAYLPKGHHHKKYDLAILRISKALDIESLYNSHIDQLRLHRAKATFQQDSVEDYWRLRQLGILAVLQQLEKDNQTTMRKALSLLSLDSLRPTLNLNAKRPGLAALYFFQLDYGLIGGSRPYDSALDFGRDLLIEMFESEIDYRTVGPSKFDSGRLLRFTSGRYIDWTTCNRKIDDQDPKLLRSALQNQWQSKSEFLALLNRNLSLFEDEPEKVVQLASKLGILKNKINYPKKNKLFVIWVPTAKEDPLFQLRFQRGLTQKTLKSLKICELDPVQYSLVAMHDSATKHFIPNKPTIKQPSTLLKNTALSKSATKTTTRTFVVSAKDHWNCSQQCMDQIHQYHKQFTQGQGYWLFATQVRLITGGLYFQPVSFPANWDDSAASSHQTLMHAPFSTWPHVRYYLTHHKSDIHRRELNYWHRTAVGITASDIQRCLEVMTASEKEEFLNWLFLHSSVQGRNSYLRPLLSEKRQARLDVVNQRQKKLAQANIRSALGPSFKSASRMTKIHYLQSMCASDSAFEFKHEHMEFLRTENYLLKDILAANDRFSFNNSFTSWHRELVQKIIRRFKGQFEKKLAVFLSKPDCNVNSYSLAMLFEFLATESHGKLTPSLKNLLRLACKCDFWQLSDIAFFELSPKQANKIYQEIKPTAPPHETTTIMNTVSTSVHFKDYEGLIYSLATKSWKAYIEALADNKEMANSLVFSLTLLNSARTHVFRSTTDKSILRSLEKCLLKHGVKPNNSRNENGLFSDLYFHSSQPSMHQMTFLNFAQTLFRSEEDKAFHKVYSLILGNQLKLSDVKELCHSDSDRLKFSRLCHKLGAVALSEKDFLLKQLNHKEDRIVIAAILALSRVDWSAKFMLKELTKLIQDKSRSGYIRCAAICAMRRFESNPKVGMRLKELQKSTSLEPLLRETARRSFRVWEFNQKTIPNMLDWPENH